uniref:Uncharacterized protein n=1 Tax=Biomphalaria glabrata TaxID=6526 RepID=A0A2C9LSL1_BIOGL
MTTDKEKNIREIVRALDRVSESSLQNEECKQICGNLLDAFYFACKAKVEFAKEETESLGFSLVKNIDKILSGILQFAYFFEPREGPCALKYRSALQYVLDEFKDFQINESLNTGQNVLDIKIKQSDALKNLDDAIDFWKEDLTVGLDIEGYSIESLYRPDDIPEHHTWWLPKNNLSNSVLSPIHCGLSSEPSRHGERENFSEGETISTNIFLICIVIIVALKLKKEEKHL